MLWFCKLLLPIIKHIEIKIWIFPPTPLSWHWSLQYFSFLFSSLTFFSRTSSFYSCTFLYGRSLDNNIQDLKHLNGRVPTSTLKKVMFEHSYEPCHLMSWKASGTLQRLGHGTSKVGRVVSAHCCSAWAKLNNEVGLSCHNTTTTPPPHHHNTTTTNFLTSYFRMT